MEKEVVFEVMRSEVMGILTFRGMGKLFEIAKVSKADVFNEDENPKGTQRGLKIQHAKSAYSYVKNNEFCFWPEVVLCCRDSNVIEFVPLSKGSNWGHLHVDMEKIEKLKRKKAIGISRVDGNHRLYFAEGMEDGYSPIEKIASFCLLMNLSLEQEIQLFRDINNNLERMPTSHLDYITVKLTEEDELKKKDPSLYIAQKLADDRESPFYKRISKSGKKTEERNIPLRSLKTGIEYLRSNTKDLQTLSGSDIDIEYIVIRDYFIALKEWQPKAWEEPENYLLFRGSGFWGACFLGGVVIDRCISNGKLESEDMLSLLKSGKDWDWSNSGDFKGLGGRGGAKAISENIKKLLPTKAGISIIAIRDKVVSRLGKK